MIPLAETKKMKFFRYLSLCQGQHVYNSLMSDHQYSGSKHSGSSTCNLPNVHLYTKMTNYHLFVKGTSEATLTIF